MMYLKLKAIEWSQHFSHHKSLGFLRHSRAANSTVQDHICPNFEPIQAFIVDLVTCKNKEDPIKNNGARVVTSFFINLKDAQGQLTP